MNKLILASLCLPGLVWGQNPNWVYSETSASEIHALDPATVVQEK